MQAQSEEENVKYVLPKEGAFIWIDFMTIPSGAREVELAHLWINFLLEREIAAKNTNYTYYPSPLRRELVEDLLDPEILENPAVYPPPDAKPRNDRANYPEEAFASAREDQYRCQEGLGELPPRAPGENLFCVHVAGNQGYHDHYSRQRIQVLGCPTSRCSRPDHQRQRLETRPCREGCLDEVVERH
uniref:Extracellular solute-binding protein n=1 Tax=Thermofilum pendens TaxID=2269 RepID=A0A7C3SKA8_THEPE